MNNLFIFHFASIIFLSIGILVSTTLFAPDYIQEFLIPKMENGRLVNFGPIACVAIVLHLFIFKYGFSKDGTLKKIFELIKDDKKGNFVAALKLMVFGAKTPTKK